MKKIKAALISIVCIVVLSSFCSVTTEVSGKNATRTVRVAVQNYPCYLLMHEDGSVTGYVYEYLQTIAQYTGWEYEFVEMDLAEAIEAIKTGEIDLLPGVQYTDERAQYMDYSSAPMGEGGTVLCVMPEKNTHAFNDFASFDGMRIATLNGSVRTEEVRERLAEYGAEAEFVVFDSDTEAKKALEDGKVDAVLMSNSRCEEKYKIVARVSNMPVYFALNQWDSSLKEETDYAMELIHLQNPYYEAELDKKYYGDVIEQVLLTSEEIAYVNNVGAITVAISEEMEPLEYFDQEERHYAGIVMDFYNLISEYTGLEFMFVARGEEETLKAQIKEDEVQLIGSMINDEELAGGLGVRLTDTYYKCSLTAVVNNKVENYYDKSITVAVQQGYSVFQKAAQNLGYTDIIYYESLEACIDAVNKGTAAMTLIPTYSRERLVEHAYYRNISSFTLPDTDYEFSIGVSQNTDGELYSILNKAIAAIDQETRNGLVIANLENTKLSNISWKDFLAEHILLIMGIGLVISCVMAVITYWRYLERKRMNEVLQESVEQAEYARRAKDDFLSRMSHDMRTPMNAIIGISTLGEEEAQDEASRDYFKNILLSAEFLLGLINDILDMSKIENTDFTLHPVRYSIADFTRQIESSIVPLCRQKNITFLFEKEEIGAEIAVIDRLRFEQIMINLLTNAVKFTPSGGTIELRIKSLEMKGRISRKRFIIRDNGIGMSPQFMEHMYEPFAQEHSTLMERTEGSGLGLAIVNKLISMMGGTIQCNSEPGKGTEFIIEMDMEICEQQESAQETEKRQQKQEYHLKGKKILLCDDHPLNTQIARKVLEKQGIQVITAVNGSEGLRIFSESETGAFDAILMDIRMPVMDGLTAAKKIRQLAREDAKRIPIIAMTANAYEEDREKSQNAGMNEHLAKPIEPSHLYEVLEAFIGEKKEKEQGV